MIKTITNKLFLLVTMLLLSTMNALADNVAEIDGTKYATLAEAIAAVPANGTQTTITMLADETVAAEGTMTIAAGKNIVLDLNGKTIAGSTAVNNATFYFLTNKGTLTVTDTSANKDGKITFTATNPNTGYKYEYVTVYNFKGTLTLEAGTIENTSGYLSYAVNNSSNCWGENVTTVLNVTGGTISAPSGDAALRVYQNSGAATWTCHNIVNISGGKIAKNGIFFDTNLYTQNPSQNFDGSNIKTEVNITGGIVEGLIDLKIRHPYNTSLKISDNATLTDTRLRAYKYAPEYATAYGLPTEALVNIDGGNLTFASGKTFEVTNANVANSVWAEDYKPFALTGGTYNVDPSAYVADGYKAVDNGDGTWTVSPAAVAQIGDVKYATLADAIAAVQGDQTIKLIADVTVSSTEEYLGKNFVLDGDGHTIDMSSAITPSTYPLLFGDGDFSFSNTSFTSGWTSTNKQNYNVIICGDNQNTTAQLSNVSISADSQTALCVQGSGAIKTTATLENMTITNTGSRTGGDDWRSAAVATAFGGIVIINSGTYTSTAANGQAVRQFSSGGDITINGGVFSGKIVAQLDKGSYSQYPAIITINGGTFNNCSLEVINNIGDTSANIVIYGGTFDCDPSDYVADGYEAVDNGDGTWTVQEAIGPVMILGGEEEGAYYATVEEAFAAVKDGQTISLNEDITLSEALNLELAGKTVIFDLGSYTLTGRVNLKSGTLTVQNGTVKNPGGQALNVYGSATSGAQNYSVLNVACNVQDADFGVCMFGQTASTNGYGAVVNILPAANLDCTGEGTIFVSGNLGNNIADDMNNVINIEGQVYGSNSVGVALNGNATVNVKEGAIITGNTAIAIKRGVLNVIGGTVWGEGDENLNPSANNNGVELTGAAISMTNTYNNYGSMAVNISGGDIISDKSVALFKKKGTYTNDATFAVSGGTFSSPVPAEFCAEGYVPTALENNQYGVKQAEPVAKIGDVEYTTLEAAVEAATSGQTIELLQDIDLSNHERSASHDIILNNVTLDLKGNTIRGFNSGVRYSGTNAVIKNGTFDFVAAEPRPNYGLSIGSYTDGAAVSDNMTIEDVHVIGGVNVDKANVTFNNVNIDMTDATFYALWADEDGTNVVYNSGTINYGANATAIFGVAKTNASLKITGGTINTGGKTFRLKSGYQPVEVSGGLFDVQVPDDCCAAGYEAVDNGDGTWTVKAKDFTITTFKDDDLNSVFVDKVAGEPVSPTVTVKAKTGQTITLIIAPTADYSLKSLSLNGGAQLEAVESDKDQRTFVMPAANVTISAEFVLNETESVKTIEEATISDEGKATITNVEIAQEGVKNVTVSAAIGSADVTEIAAGAFASLPNTVQTIDLSSTQVALEGKRSENPVLKDIPATALVYLPSSSSEVEGTNVVIKGENSDNYTCLDFQMDDMNDYSIPTPFTATTATLNRPFASGTHCTICLPYDVPASDINLYGKIYRYTGFDSAAAAPAIEMTEDNDGLDANVPYIFVPSGNSESISTSSTSGTIQVSMSVAPQESINGFTFKGVFEEKHFTPGEYQAGIYGYAGVDTETTTTGYFYKLGLQAWVPAMRAYLVSNSAISAAPSINGAQAAPALPSKIKVILKSATGETTDILHFDMETAEDDAPVYNLSGQRVNNATKGIYIKNGKKVVIK